MTRCKRCGAWLTLPAHKDDGNGLKIRDTYFGALSDKQLDYLHHDYRERDPDDHQVVWGLCNDCAQVRFYVVHHHDAEPDRPGPKVDRWMVVDRRTNDIIDWSYHHDIAAEVAETFNKDPSLLPPSMR